MKILAILHIPPPVHGSSMVGQYIKDSNIINKSFDSRYVNLGTSTSMDEIGKNPLRKISRYLFILWQVFVQLLKFKPSLCYFAITVKGLGFYKDALVALLVKAFGIKLVFHFHNKGVSTRQNHWFDNLLYSIVFRNSEVILLSEYLYLDIRKYFTKEQIHYCPNGIPEKTRRQKTKDKRHKTEILFLSNLIESKGVFVLLAACKLLQEKELLFHCTFIGGESNVTAKLFHQKIKELNLYNSVDYIGRKYGAEKDEAFAKSDIFAFPTYYYNECFPLVLLEAMQFSLPIISTFEGGIPDIVKNGETGFLVQQKDVIALAEKLEFLIKNKVLREEMGSNGRLRYEQYFTLKHFENNLTNILNKCISKQTD